MTRTRKHKTIKSRREIGQVSRSSRGQVGRELKNGAELDVGERRGPVKKNDLGKSSDTSEETGRHRDLEEEYNT